MSKFVREVAALHNLEEGEADAAVDEANAIDVEANSGATIRDKSLLCLLGTSHVGLSNG